jgi:hypothetical protein
MKRWDNAEEMAMSCHPVVLFPLKPVKKRTINVIKKHQAQQHLGSLEEKQDHNMANP